MKPIRLKRKLLFNGKLLALVAGLAPIPQAPADPVGQLRSLSALKDVDLSKLSHGDVAAAGAPLGQLERGVSVQSAYVVRAPVRSTISLIQQWNPTRHPQLGIFLQGDLPASAGPQNFHSLAS